MLFGADFTKSKTDYWTFGDFNDPNPGLAIDLFNPTYGIAPSLFTAARTIRTSARNFSVFHDQWYGVYLQDQVTLWNRLHLLAGGGTTGRKSGAGGGASFEEARATVDEVTRKDTRFNPRFGLLYDVTPWLAVYGNFVTSFGANNGVTATNQPLPPANRETKGSRSQG